MASGVFEGTPPGTSNFWLPLVSLVEATSTISQHGAVFARDDKATAKDKQGLGIISFLTAIGVSLIIFAAQFSLFALLRNKLARIL
jgi:hypothetical protein